MPDTNHDQNHEGDCTTVAKDVDEDLNNWLSDFTVHRCVKLLDGEEKRNEEKKAKNCGDAD